MYKNKTEKTWAGEIKYCRWIFANNRQLNDNRGMCLLCWCLEPALSVGYTVRFGRYKLGFTKNVNRYKRKDETKGQNGAVNTVLWQQKRHVAQRAS